jgi:dynactin complex subunit
MFNVEKLKMKKLEIADLAMDHMKRSDFVRASQCNDQLEKISSVIEAINFISDDFDEVGQRATEVINNLIENILTDGINDYHIDEIELLRSVLNYGE